MHKTLQMGRGSIPVPFGGLLLVLIVVHDLVVRVVVLLAARFAAGLRAAHVGTARLGASGLLLL